MRTFSAIVVATAVAAAALGAWVGCSDSGTAPSLPTVAPPAAQPGQTVADIPAPPRLTPESVTLEGAMETLRRAHAEGFIPDQMLAAAEADPGRYLESARAIVANPAAHGVNRSALEERQKSLAPATSLSAGAAPPSEDCLHNCKVFASEVAFKEYIMNLNWCLDWASRQEPSDRPAAVNLTCQDITTPIFDFTYVMALFSCTTRWCQDD